MIDYMLCIWDFEYFGNFQYRGLVEDEIQDIVYE